MVLVLGAVAFGVTSSLVASVATSSLFQCFYAPDSAGIDNNYLERRGSNLGAGLQVSAGVRTFWTHSFLEAGAEDG